MARIAVWAGVFVVTAAALGGAFDESPTDSPAPATIETVSQSTSVDTVSPPTESSTTSTVTERAGSAGGSPTQRTTATIAPADDDEIDCNNWEDYADSGEYDVEDIADICALDDEEISDWEDE